MVGYICIGLIIGMFIGRCLREPENDCPSVELGYKCKSDDCDHSKSVLYRAKMDIALHNEKSKDQNY